MIDVPNEFDLLELAEECEREVKQRERVFPRMVTSGKLSQRTADRRIRMMAELARRLRVTAHRRGDRPTDKTDPQGRML